MARRRAQSEDSESRSLFSEEQCEETSQYDTFPGSTGSATELRYLMRGDEDLMDRACGIILRERVEESETRHRKGHACGRKISVVKTPSIWVRNEAFCCCFSSRVKSINNQMLDCASLVFPGPHAFLLVSDNRKVPGKVCLKTITDVFGEEALDYAIVLIIGRTKLKDISSDVKQGIRVYTLEDNEQSVQNLFIITERMSRNKESTFFIQPSYENLMKKAFLPWEKERDAEIRRETAKNLKEEFAAKTEQHDKEVFELKEKLRIAKSEIKDKEEKHTQKLSELEKTSKITENNLKKDKDILKRLMLNTYIHLKSKDGQQKDEPGATSAHQSLLNQELEACIHNQADFTHIFSSIIDGYIHRENELKKKLDDSELEIDTLRNMYSSIFDDFIGGGRVKEENKELQKEVDQLKTIERELKQTLREKEDREADLDRREADVTRRENELEAKEREMAERDTHLSGSESNICHGGESGEEDSKPEDHESESGCIEPVRRNSIEYNPPSMSGSEHGYLAL